MPELPDAEVFRTVVERTALHRRIARMDLRDAGRLKGARPKDLATLEGRTFDRARRHGKMVFAVPRQGPCLVMHFGMTGFLAAYRDETDEPGHPRLVIDFRGGGHLAFDNQRKFGWVELAEGPEAYLEEEGIGPDALDVALDDFVARIGASAGAVKSVLMDQRKVAGIGNVYSDEILFQARTAPHARADRLGEKHLGGLRQTMRRVLSKAVAVEADRSRMPRGWLTPRRGEGEPCPRCGGEIATRRVGGRTAHWCPSCQRE